jgi:hypothetical protein
MHLIGFQILEIFFWVFGKSSLYGYSRLNDAHLSTTRQTRKKQQLERPISQQPVILFDSNFGDQ